MPDTAYALLCFLFVPLVISITYIICTGMEWISRATCAAVMWAADRLGL